MTWQPMETAPRDGTLFIARNADHPNWGPWPIMRRINWHIDHETGKPFYEDGGGWIQACDANSFEGVEGPVVSIPCSIAMDKYNTSVRYEWTPLPGTPN